MSSAEGEVSGRGRCRGLASIIVPCWNQVEFTRLCLQALFRSTRPGSWELIVVDNGSTDETAAYLAGVRDASDVPVTVITNARNVGFPAAVNQGLQAASGEFLVLLNNDAVVTDGWLEHLAALTAARLETPDESGCGDRDGLLNTKAPRKGERRRRRPDGGSGWSGRCPITPRRRNWSRMCPIATSMRCTIRRAVARAASRPVVHRRQALGVLPADDPGRVSGRRRAG